MQRIKNPSTLLCKDSVSRFLSIATAESGIKSFFKKRLGFDKQPKPGERLGAGVEIGKLVTRGETKHDGARASLNIFFHPIDQFVPRAGSAKHRVGHCLVGQVVILSKESLSFEARLFYSCRLC